MRVKRLIFSTAILLAMAGLTHLLLQTVNEASSIFAWMAFGVFTAVVVGATISNFKWALGKGTVPAGKEEREE